MCHKTFHENKPHKSVIMQTAIFHSLEKYLFMTNRSSLYNLSSLTNIKTDNKNKIHVRRST